MTPRPSSARAPRLLSWIEWLKRFRYIKFGTVGASGTVVNMAVLFVAQEYLFRAIEAPRDRLYASIALAICLATLNNFTWNRLWTWADRPREAASHAGAGARGSPIRRLARQFGQYAIASWLGIALQYGLTLWLSNFLHYLLANVIAIVIASISNFLANDRWTFGRRSKPYGCSYMDASLLFQGQALRRSPDAQAEAWSTAVWLVLLGLAFTVYAFGLGGQYVPTNGDEMVYAHIARETAQTGHWLPLASELEYTRNTKPPLLFWQAMLVGDWGQRWELAALRAPSLLYTLLLAAAVAWTVRLITRSTRDALLAACVYLVFFSTFRYGRPYLTSAPETFWLSLPLFGLLWQRLRTTKPPAALSHPGWGLHVLFGLALGLGLAYKSFALIAPAAAAWWLALLLSAARLDWRELLFTTLRVAFSSVLALAVFALWFVLDPDPAAVWREFIVAENLAKFSDARGYWHEALALGGSSLWSQLLAYPVNAGLLFFAVLGLAWTGFKKLRQPGFGQPWPPHLKILLAWTAVWLLVFLFPSQRSARYVIPAMPAVAMLLALYWGDIARRWFLPTLPLVGLALLVLGRIAWVSSELGLASNIELGLTLLAAGSGAIVIAAGLLQPAWTRTGAVLAGLLVYATFDLTVAPMDGPAGRYANDIGAQLSHRARIAVPNSFNGQFERFQFQLPGQHQFAPYDSGARALARVAPGASLSAPAQQLEQLLATHDAVIWVQSSRNETSPPCPPTCTVLGKRWLLRSRHQRGEITLANLWYPQEWLFRREWLLTRAAPR